MSRCALAEGTVFGRILTFPDCLGHRGHYISVMRKVGSARGDERHLVTAGSLGMIGKTDPPLLVGALILASPGAVWVDSADEVIHRIGHGIIMLCDDARIRIFAVHAVDTKNPGV